MSKSNLNKRTLTLENENENEKEDAKKSDSSKKNRKKKFFKKNGKNGNSGKFKGKLSNDPIWHGKNSQITKDLCSIPFNTMVGFPPKAINNFKYMLGAIRSYFVDWFAGTSSDFRSFLNTAATNLWEFIRSRNSGATNYQSADIFINVILGCLDMFATTTYLESFFTHVGMYSVYNRLIPKTFFEMRRVDYEDFISNIANYRGRFNLLIAKMSAVVVPDQFPIYNWVMSMFVDVYKDRDSETGREQLYVPVKQNYHIFDATTSPQGGMVRTIELADFKAGAAASRQAIVFTPNSPIVKFSFLLDILEKQINAVITDEDCNIIFGDLIKAYGSEGKFFKFNPLSETEAKVPVYSEEFLAQFHNCIMPPSLKINSTETLDNTVEVAVSTYYNEIKQDQLGYLITEFFYYIDDPGTLPSLKESYYNDDIDLLLDTNESNPSPENVMTMTRWHNRYKYTIKNSGVHFFGEVTISTASAILIFNGAIAFVNQDNVVYGEVDQIFENGNLPIQACLLSNFDWSPICYIKSTTGGFYPQDAQYVLGDINNIQPVKRDTIARIHDVDFASLYDVPFTGKF